MQSKLKIDIVSDVSCPWCIIGYKALESALSELKLLDSSELNWKAFELNPHMPADGQDLREHIQQKYGASAEQSAANRDNIAARGEALGFNFNFADDSRIYNTFNAHRLLHWAKEHDLQTQLKLALFDMYFTEHGDPSDPEQLLAVVESVGLDAAKAKEILESDLYEKEVRSEQEKYRNLGINAVPSFIINDKHLIKGGQPAEVFKSFLQELSAKSDS